MRKIWVVLQELEDGYIEVVSAFPTFERAEAEIRMMVEEFAKGEQFEDVGWYIEECSLEGDD